MYSLMVCPRSGAKRGLRAPGPNRRETAAFDDTCIMFTGVMFGDDLNYHAKMT